MAVQERTFAEVFREARGRAGLTQAAAAVRLGVSLRIVQDWEADKKQPGLPMLKRCALLFGWELPFLYASDGEAKGRLVSFPFVNLIELPGIELARSAA